MATITIEIPDDLSSQLEPLKDQLPDLLRLCLQPTTLLAPVYRYILDFLASQPTPEQIADFRPAADMQERLKTLVERSHAGDLSAVEQAELDEYARIEHLIILLKAGNLPFLARPVAS